MKERRFDPHNPVGMFNTCVPIGFQKEILKVVVSQYGKAYEHCQEHFDSGTCDDVLPYYRRAMIEEELGELARRFKKEGAVSRLNDAHNCSHNVLLLGDRIAITQSKVDGRRALPREAGFRTSYAQSPQMVFEFAKDDNPCAGVEVESVLYGIVVHAPSEIPSCPLFVDIIFPDAAYEQIVDRIRLLEKFPDVAEHLEPLPEEIVPEFAQKLQLRRSSSSENTA
jgi:hypothetical protein